MQPRLHRASWHGKHSSYFLDAQVFAIKEVRDFALFRVSSRNRRRQICTVVLSLAADADLRSDTSFCLRTPDQPAVTLIAPDRIHTLSAFGYLAALSLVSYESLGSTWANVLVGLASAIVDNIPVMFAVLSIEPDMSHGQWLLVTLTAGVGGSLLSIGSAAGVALVGQARGVYPFFAHLKWT